MVNTEKRNGLYFFFCGCVLATVLLHATVEKIGTSLTLPPFLPPISIIIMLSIRHKRRRMETTQQQGGEILPNAELIIFK